MQGQPLRWLCWIDEPNTSRAVGAVLRRCGFETAGAVTSPAEALVATGGCEPDVVVLDLALTGELGLGAVQALHAVAPKCAVVVVSSFDTMRPAALQAGAYDFVGLSDLRLLERCMRRLAADLQVALEASSPPTTARRGSRSTKAPSS